MDTLHSEAELKDDLADHPCSADHKQERNALVLRFQNIAQRKHLRISFMSGDVHATANSQFKSTKKVDPSQDPKFMLQSERDLLASHDIEDLSAYVSCAAVISSAIVNTPPPPPVIWLVSKLGKKTHKVRQSSCKDVWSRPDSDVVPQPQTLHHAHTDEELIPLFTEDVSS